MKNKFKVAVSSIMITSLMFGTVVSAASPKLYNITKNKSYMEITDEAIEQIIIEGLANDKFAKSVNEKLVNYDEYRAKVATIYTEAINSGKTEEQAAAAVVAKADEIREELDEVPIEELKVEKVSAINQTIDVAGTLEFEVNGNKIVTVKDLGEDYTVEFLATKSVFVGGTNKSATGELAVDLDNANLKEGEDYTFEYEVVVNDKDGKEVAKSTERGTVTVEDESEMIEEMQAAIEVGGVELDNLVLGLLGNYDVKVTGKTKDMKADVKAGVLNSGLYTIKSSTPAVVSVSGTTLTANAKGKATITVSAKEGSAQDIVLEVEVKDAAKVNAEKSEATLEKNEIATTETTKITLNLKDDNGNVVVGKAGSFTLKGVKLVTLGEVKEDAKVAGKYTLEIAGKAKGTEKLVLVVNEVEIAVGEITVKEAKDVIVKHELVVSEDGKAIFDLKEGSDTTLTLLAKGYDDQGLEVPTQPVFGAGDGQYKIKSSDKKVVTVANNTVTLAANAKAGNTVTVELHKNKGALSDKVAEIEISVVDTTPELTTVKFVDDFKVEKLDKELDIKKLVELKAEDKDGKAVELDVILVEGLTFKIVELVKNGEEDPVEGLTLGTLNVKLSNVSFSGNTKFKVSGKGSVYLSVISNEVFKDDLTITVDTTAAEAAEAKIAFLAELADEVAKIDVANVILDGDNIEVTFTNINPVSVKVAAEKLVQALISNVKVGTITIGGVDYDLTDANVVTNLANALSEGSAAYTAEITNNYGVEFNLDGTVSFTLPEIETPDAE